MDKVGIYSLPKERFVAQKKAGNDKLKLMEKVIIFAFVSLIVGLPQEIRKALIANFDIDIKFMRTFILIITCLYVFRLNYIKKTFRAPHLIAFTLFFSMVYIFEKYLKLYGAPNITLVVIYGQIYILFLLLVNLGHSRLLYLKIIDYAFYSSLSFCLLYWLGFYGVIDIQPTDTQALNDMRFAGLSYQNFVSYLCGFGILLLIIRRLKDKTFAMRNIISDVVCLLLFYGMIMLQATRSASILGMFLTMYYASMVVNHKIANRKRAYYFLSVLIMMILVMSFLVSELFLPLFFKTVLSQRFTSQVGREFRIENAQNAWDNFIEHPFIGVGYDQAAIRDSYGTRSNNEYLQILGASGVVVFAVYLYSMFRLIVSKFRLFRRPEIMLSAFFFAFLLNFERPLDTAAIMGYIAVFLAHDSGSGSQGHFMGKK